MASRLQLTQDRFEGVPMIRVSGDLVYGEDVGALRDLAVLLTEQGHRDAILDLRDVAATDSTGLGALLEFRRSLGDGTGTVYMLQPPERLRTHLHVTHVESIFTVLKSEETLRRRLQQTS